MIIVPMNVFNRKEVLDKGQLNFIRTAAAAGADGIEIRRELLTANDSFSHLKEELTRLAMFTVYSAPSEVWGKGGTINSSELTKVFEEARSIGAKWLKLPLGHYVQGVSDPAELDLFLKEYKGLQLLIENDQTPHGGKIEHLADFFESASKIEIPVRMTFDIGNWHFTGVKPESAFSRLREYISYLHLKEVALRDGELHPAELSAAKHAGWRMFQNRTGKSVPVALEFPIQPHERLKEFIGLARENQMEG
ncbi:sugar phosphate isomerase/epimerase family protein [Metabacillus indicus]|uniref:sugar phosphate isomerase/epimerase family protein n=1 Tax=Metabacillus indicus TaxID=246786 RepID=UPI003CF5E7EF